MISGKKFVLLISFLILILIIGAVYFSIKGKNRSSTPKVIEEKTAEQIAAELQAFRPDETSTKTPEQIKRELSSFKAPTSKNGPSDAQILKDLQNVKP